MSDGDRRVSLTRRLLVLGAFAALGLILLLTLLVDRSIRSVWLDDLDSDLATVASVVRGGIPEDPAELATWVSVSGDAAQVRITVIDSAGRVLADSREDPATMGDHGSRPEVVASRSGQLGKASRVSASTGISERYVALPVEGGVIVRASTATAAVEEELARTRAAITRVAFVVAAVALGLLALFGRRLARPAADLADTAEAIASGQLRTIPTRSPVAEYDRLGVALSSIARDLGGRVDEAEQASSLLQVVLSTIPQGTVLFDGADQVIYSNPAAAMILGRVPDTLGALVPLQIQNAVRTARTGGETVVDEVDHGLPLRRLRAIATPFAEDPRVLLVVVDVTERARLDTVRRDFVVNASHELKTPVATIIASSEALNIALSRDDPAAEKFAARIEESARQLERLVSDLLDLSRLERETPELGLTRLDQVVQEELERTRSRIDDNGLLLVTEVEPVTVSGNRGDLSLAVRNLLDNAIRYTSRGGTVTVRAGARDGEARVEVSDTGEGVPTKDIGRVFERFYRVDSARSRGTGGTGLGLAIVKHVAESHGGTVSLVSELGRGSVFTVAIPLSANEASVDN